MPVDRERRIEDDWLKRSTEEQRPRSLNSNPLLFGFVVFWPEAGGEIIISALLMRPGLFFNCYSSFHIHCCQWMRYDFNSAR